MTTADGTRTFLESLVAAINKASNFNSQDQDPPVAVLWPDKDRQWEPLIPALRNQAPIFSLGKYSPADNTGPAYWLRCIVAQTIPHPSLQPNQVPIFYLPGYSRRDLRVMESCPPELEPLAELQYRGVVWTQRNARDWTISAFLQNTTDGGLGVEVAPDSSTKTALQQSLLKLAAESTETLRRAAPLQASFLYDLLQPDDVRNILSWINDPTAFQNDQSPEGWEAFAAVCRQRYNLDPKRDSPITGAEKLGQREGIWETVWQRFKESPTSYRSIPERLREAKPEKNLHMFEVTESWPQDSERAEEQLRTALLNLRDYDPGQAGQAIIGLESGHGHRRDWVWNSLGWSPLAEAIEHLATISDVAATTQHGTSVQKAIEFYTGKGWNADMALLDALASVDKSADMEAIKSAVRAVYQPWLQSMAETFQKVIADSDPSEYQTAGPVEAQNGTCIFFTDGLRFDISQRLGTLLSERNVEANIEAGLTTIPSVTATAKPAMSPAAAQFQGGQNFDTTVKASGSKTDAGLLRKVLAGMGFQALGATELGDPTGRGWTELGDIDRLGHTHESRAARSIPNELTRLAERVINLLDHGWQKVVVITDHGWILLPGGMPKAELKEHLTEARKGRCARLKVGAQTEFQVAPWHWDNSIRVAIAPGIHCFEASKEYEHGGLSPQECIVPILTASRTSQTSRVEIASVRWRRLRCNIQLQGATDDHRVDIRTRPNDPSSTIVQGGGQPGVDETLSLLVENEELEESAAVVVVTGPDGVVLAQDSTIVGGS